LKCCEYGKVNSKNHKKSWGLWISLFIGFISSLLLILYIVMRKTRLEDKEYPCSSLDKTRLEIPIENSEMHEQKTDDLTIILGIGPKISNFLYSVGINSFKKLSEKSPDDLRNILNQQKMRLNDPETWPEQARLASLDQLDKLREFQNKIKNKKE